MEWSKMIEEALYPLRPVTMNQFIPQGGGGYYDSYRILLTNGKEVAWDGTATSQMHRSRQYWRQAGLISNRMTEREFMVRRLRTIFMESLAERQQPIS